MTTCAMTSRSRSSVGRMPCSSNARSAPISPRAFAVPADIRSSTWMCRARCTRPIYKPTRARPSPRWKSSSARVRRLPTLRSGWESSRRSSPSWSSCSSEISRRRLCPKSRHSLAEPSLRWPPLPDFAEQRSGVSHEPVRPILKHVVPGLRVDAMDHEIRMVLDQPEVLVRDGLGVTLALWIEDHHRDMKIPEHHARDHRVLAPLQRRNHRRPRGDRLHSELSHQCLEVREKGPLPAHVGADPTKHVEVPTALLPLLQLFGGHVAHDLLPHLELRGAKDLRQGIRDGLTDLLGGLPVVHVLERPRAAVRHQ